MILPLLNEIYTAKAQANPQQPLTLAVASNDLTNPLAQFALRSCDIISFHTYQPLMGHYATKNLITLIESTITL